MYHCNIVVNGAFRAAGSAGLSFRFGRDAMQISAVIFDMDGLMLDSERLYRAACQQAATELGYVLADGVHARMMGKSAANSERVLTEEFGPGFPIREFAVRCGALEAAVLECGPLPKKSGLDPLLDFLEARRIRKAVATSTRRARAVPQLAAVGLLERFAAVVTGDDVATGKPEPHIFLLAAQRLRVEPETCLVLEDSEPGVVAAHRAGMRVFAVPDLQALPPATEKLADRVFDSLDLVERYLKQTLTSGASVVT
jgi:HAD superfamily hydrolase (TIGR01509 family)